MKLDVYEHLLRFNAGFDQAIQSLAALRKHSAFHRGVLERFAQLSKETRAATNSYLAAVIETGETEEAGRRFRKRKAQERRRKLPSGVLTHCSGRRAGLRLPFLHQ